MASSQPRPLRRRRTATEDDLDDEFLRSSKTLREDRAPPAAPVHRTSSAIFEEAFLETVSENASKPRPLQQRLASFMLEESLDEVLDSTSPLSESTSKVELVQFNYSLTERKALGGGVTNAISIESSEQHGLIVNSNGTISGWGDNGDFQLALGWRTPPLQHPLR